MVAGSGTAGGRRANRKGVQGIDFKTPKSLNLVIQGLREPGMRRNLDARKTEAGVGLENEELRCIPAKNDEPPSFDLELDGIGHGSLRSAKSSACEKSVILQRFAKVVDISLCHVH